MTEDENQRFEVAVRIKPDGFVWTDWSVITSGLSPREARTLLIRHVGTLTNSQWEVIGITRAEITLENASGGTRAVVRMKKMS